MTELSTEYRGYKIRYSENADEWTCRDLDVDAATLSKAKGKIDALMLKNRKGAALDVLCLRGSETSGYYRGRAIDHMARHNSRYNRETGGYDRYLEHSLGVMAKTTGREREGKSFKKISSLVLPSEEALLAIGNHSAAVKLLDDQREECRRLYRLIPRVTEDDIADLIAASRPKDGDK